MPKYLGLIHFFSCSKSNNRKAPTRRGRNSNLNIFLSWNQVFLFSVLSELIQIWFNKNFCVHTKPTSFIDKCVQSVSFLSTVCHRFIALLAVLEYFTFLKDKELNSLGFCFGLTDCKESSIFYSLYSSSWKARHFYRSICPTSFVARVFFCVTFSKILNIFIT